MAYCDSTDITAPATMSADDITKAIASSTREINNYLRSKGITGVEGVDDLKEAAIKLVKAAIVEWRVLNGQYVQATGEMITGTDPNAAAAATSATKLFRQEAYDILDRYASATSTQPPGSTGIAIVRNYPRRY